MRAGPVLIAAIITIAVFATIQQGLAISNSLIRPPPDVVAQIVQVPAVFPSNGYSNLSVTFKLSPDDPNQVSGSFVYNLTIYVCGKTPNGAAACASHTACGSPAAPGCGTIFPWTDAGSGSGCALEPVPHRRGWVQCANIRQAHWQNYTIGQTFPISGIQYPVFNISVNASNPGISAAVPSCNVQVAIWKSPMQFNVSELGNVSSPGAGPGHAQCGPSPVLPPPGGTTLYDVTPIINASSSGKIIATWQTSVGDWNRSRGNVTYRPFLTIPGEFNETDPQAALAVVTGGGVNGTMQTPIITGPPQSQVMLEVRAEDSWSLTNGGYWNGTYWWSSLSCPAIVQTGKPLDLENCGTSTYIPVIGGGQPSFPGLNVPALATSSNVPAANLGLALGFFMIMGLVAFAKYYAGSLAGGAAGLLGLALAYAWNDVGGWVLVVIFMASVALVVFVVPAGGRAARAGASQR
jgi:hypothetical protein